MVWLVYDLELHVSLLTVPSSPPTNLQVIPASSYSLHASWDVPPSADQNGPILGYFVNVTAVKNAESFSLVSNETTFTINSLLPYSNYSCSVAAYTSAGMGPFGELVFAETQQAGEFKEFYVQ